MPAKPHANPSEMALITVDTPAQQIANAWAADVWATDRFIFNPNFGAQAAEALH